MTMPRSKLLTIFTSAHSQRLRVPRQNSHPDSACGAGAVRTPLIVIARLTGWGS